MTPLLPLDPASGDRRPDGAGQIRRGDLAIAGSAVLVAVALGPVVAMAPELALGAAAGLLLVLATALQPVWALALYVAVSPLLVGLGRGSLVPGLRLNEILLIPVLAGLGCALLVRWHRAGWQRPRGFHRLDLVVVALAVTSSVTTLLWMFARDRPIALDDVLYALALWKLAVLYAAVRLFVRNPADALRVLKAVLVSSLLIGAIGALQAVGVGPVIDVLATWVPPEEGGYELSQNRGTATLGNPIAYGDLMLYSAVAVAALAFHRRSRQLWAIALVLVVATLASGQFSMLFGLAGAAAAFAIVTGTGKQVAAAGAAVLGVAAIALQPVIAARTSAADPQTGLPVSWTGRYGRLDNLQTYFWPEIGADFNWLFGVQTSSRMPGREYWREWVYIESGYTWALWNGGLPLLLSVVALLVVMVQTGRRLRRQAGTVAPAMGTTLVVLPCALGLLMLLDPHLTLRGGGELFFVLLAIGATLAASGPDGAGPPGPRPTVGQAQEAQARVS